MDMAEPLKALEKGGDPSGKCRVSRSPSPVLIYPPPQHPIECSVMKPPSPQPSTTWPKPALMPNLPLPEILPLKLEAVRDTQKSPLKAEEQTVLPAETPPGQGLRSEALDSLCQQTTIAADLPPPLPDVGQTFSERSESPPPPVPPLPASYLAASSPVYLSQDQSKPVSDVSILAKENQTPPFPFNPVENNLNMSQNSLGVVGSSMCRDTTPSPEERHKHPQLRKPRQESDPFSSLTDVPAPSPTSPKATVVTDLDQAMAQMDELKLKSRFRSQSSPMPCDSDVFMDNPVASTATDKPQAHQVEDEETNIDDEPASARRIATLKQKSLDADQYIVSTAPLNTTPTSRQRRKRSERDRVVPAVTFDEALKIPQNPPVEIGLQKSQEFDGETLASWLCSEFGESHYLHRTLSRHDFRLLVFQVCTHLLSLGVLTPVVEKKPPEVFKVSDGNLCKTVFLS
ncbi:protein cappuccino [Plakobranchus ocellatus]|uniref:Protein cappuccino n=1 Tax=Plakobranchus ocellatus TaxID=259542 RepID=A0AAV4CUK1_9GAST|nr:protein cappuccino [Plakobranchus ocellatus]